MSVTEPDLTAIVSQIHASRHQVVLAITGGGSAAIPALLSVPGASRTVLSAIVPYGDAALVEYLGRIPEQFCASRTARQMAMIAFDKARRTCAEGTTPLGIACTASLASDRPKRGAHRFYVAVQGRTFTECVAVELVKGARSRAEEEAIAAEFIIHRLAVAGGIADRTRSPLTEVETPTRERKDAPLSWQKLVWGEVNCVAPRSAHGTPKVVFPGAFNPPHEGHQQIAEYAYRTLGHDAVWELSVTNVDKSPLDFVEMQTRLERLSTFLGDNADVYLTAAPTFAEKAKLFPGATFLVGIDTLERIADPKYTTGSIPAMLKGIAEIVLAGCQFLVFGREVEGAFTSLHDLNLPPSLASICTAVPEEVFRNDVSSTNLRSKLWE